MKPAVKWLLGLLAFLILTPALLILLLSLLVDESDIKQLIDELAREHTNGRLTIDGNIGWSLYPHIAVELNKVSLQLVDSPDTNLAQVDQARLGVKLMPLFDGDLVINNLQLDDLQLQVQEVKTGQYDWQLLAKPVMNQANDNPGAQQAPLAALPLGLAANNVAIRNAAIVVRDMKGNVQYQLEQLSFSSEGLNNRGELFALALGFESHHPLQAKVEAETEVAWSPNQALTIGSLQAAYQARNKESDYPLIEFSTRGSLDLTTLALNLPEWTLVAKPLELRGYDLSLHTGDTKTIATRIESKPFDLDSLLAAFGQEFPAGLQKKAFEKTRLKTGLSGSDQQVSLDELELSTAEFTLQGSAQANLFTGRQQVALRSKTLNLDSILAPSPAQEKQPGKGESQAAEQPAGALLAVNGDLSVDIGQLTWSGLQFDGLSLRSSSDNGILNLRKLTSSLNGGKLDLTGKLNAKKRPARLSINATVSELPLQPLLAKLDHGDELNGIASFGAELTASGDNQDAWLNTLNGPVYYRFDQAVFTGLSLEQKVCQAVAQLRGEKLTKTWPAETRFGGLEGTLLFRQGVATQDDLAASIGNAAIRGTGTISLPGESFDYRLGIRIQGDLSEEEPACAVNERYRDLYWPIQCRGDFAADPGKWCAVDQQGISKLMQEAAKQRVEQELEKALHRGLESLFR
jgi:AsmA protein